MISQESDFFILIDQSGNYEAKNIDGQRDLMLFKDIREERKGENQICTVCIYIYIYIYIYICTEAFGSWIPHVNMRALRDYSMRLCIHQCSIGTFMGKTGDCK